MSGTPAPASPSSPPAPSATSPAAPAPFVVRRKAGGRIWVAVGVVVVAAVVAGAGATTHWFGFVPAATHAGPCPSKVTLYGAGASFLSAVMSSWQTNFASTTDNQVEYLANGAGGGITDLQEKLKDFAATDEPLNASEAAGMPGTVLTLPVTGGPVAIVYHIPSFSGTLNLTPQQLAGIYLGDITNWNSTLLSTDNHGLPNASIVTVHRNDGAGTTWALTSLFSLYNSTWASTVGTTLLPNPWPSTGQSHEEGETGNSALAKEVKAVNDSIGYVDLPDAINDGLSTAGVYNSAGTAVQPTIPATQAAITALEGQTIPTPTGNWSSVNWVNAPGATSYPLAVLSYFLVLQDVSLGFTANQTTAEVLIQWLHWVLTTGQGESAAVDYINPPADIVAQDLSALGSMEFGGAAIPACT